MMMKEFCDRCSKEIPIGAVEKVYLTNNNTFDLCHECREEYKALRNKFMNRIMLD